MSLVKILDFCEALNVKEGTVRSKISRGQIVCNEKRLIDTENPINYIYILEINGGDQSVFKKYCKSIALSNVQTKTTQASKTQTKVITNKKEVKPSVKKPDIIKKTVLEKPSKIKGSVRVDPTVETTIPKLTSDEKFERDLAKQQRDTLLEIDIEQKKANLKNIQRTAEIKQMQLEKIMGNTLPLDKVTSIMAINFKSIFKSFHSQLKNIASTMVQNLGGTKDDLNAIMIELEQSLNHIKETSKENANDDIERLVNEYSEVRSRGERK